MSAHALLVMHNLAVLDRFFEGVRGVIGSLSAEESIETEAFDVEQKSKQLFEHVRRDLGCIRTD
jgi:hypothetical protein